LRPLSLASQCTHDKCRTVRSFKVNDIQERYTEYGDKVEIVGVDDLIAGSFKDALAGT
jgi:hypothetical protein